jgi:hypothetical protein
MECLSPDHLHADGCSGWTAGGSLQQLEYHPVEVSDEISPPEGENMEVRYTKLLVIIINVQGSTPQVFQAS